MSNKVKETPKSIEYVDAIEQEDELFWKPEDYGFVLVNGDGIDRGSKWEKDKFVLIRLSSTLWVVKKDLGKQTVKTEDGTIQVRNLKTKWHMVIDNKKLADLYLTVGLRG